MCLCPVSLLFGSFKDPGSGPCSAGLVSSILRWSWQDPHILETCASREQHLSITPSRELQGGQENIPCSCCLPPAELLLLGEHHLQSCLPVLLPPLNHFEMFSIFHLHDHLPLAACYLLLCLLVLGNKESEQISHLLDWALWVC